MKVFLILLMIFPLHAAIIKNDVTGLKRQSYSLKEACTKAGFKHLLLVDAQDVVTIDCMGQKLNAKDFCLKEQNPGKSFIRGFVSASQSQVYCEYAEAVSLSLKCDQQHYKYCQNANQGCQQLRGNFAHDLELMHASLTGAPTNLNCHYSVSDALPISAL